MVTRFVHGYTDQVVSGAIESAASANLQMCLGLVRNQVRQQQLRPLETLSEQLPHVCATLHRTQRSVCR